MKTETQQQLLYIHTAFDKVNKLHNLTTERGNKMKTIKIGNDNITLDEFKNKWNWTINQFRGLITYNDSARYLINMAKLENIANEMVEDKFNSVYEAQNREVA